MSGSVISLRIDDEQKRRLDMLSQRMGRPSSFYLSEALGCICLSWSMSTYWKSKQPRSVEESWRPSR